MDFLTVPFREVPNTLLRVRLDDFARNNREDTRWIGVKDRFFQPSSARLQTILSGWFSNGQLA